MSQMIPEELEEFVTITIPQEDGTEQEFAIVDSFNADGSHYIVVSRVDTMTRLISTVRRKPRRMWM